MSHADETRAAAANVEHPWDARALDWPLTPESVVVEVGGYKGRWALQMVTRYHCRLYVFEPQPWAAAVCREVLHGTGARVLDVALGATSGAALMGNWGTDGCSLIAADGRETGAEMLEVAATFRQLKIAHIDLMLMNIEGYEYTLLPHLLDRGVLPDRLMVQFHEHADPTGDARAAIDARLAQHGYRLLWTYGPVLTAWGRV